MTVTNGDARGDLVNRVIPEMTLSDGSAASMTGPPLPFPHYLNAEGRAQYRFAVQGNAVGRLPKSIPCLEYHIDTSIQSLEAEVL